MAVELDRLKTVLVQSGLQASNNALYQVIWNLLEAVRAIQNNVTEISGGGGGGGGLSNQSFVTIDNDLATLPFSRQITAGQGISLTNTGKKLIINANLPVGGGDSEGGEGSGEAGPPGIAGIAGTAGASGATGSMGPPGIDGNAYEEIWPVVMPGPKGDSGPIGPSGAQGIPGIMGPPGQDAEEVEIAAPIFFTNPANGSSGYSRLFMLMGA